MPFLSGTLTAAAVDSQDIDVKVDRLSRVESIEFSSDSLFEFEGELIMMASPTGGNAISIATGRGVGLIRTPVDFEVLPGHYLRGRFWWAAEDDKLTFKAQVRPI